jgi:hypothetical protein
MLPAKFFSTLVMVLSHPHAKLHCYISEWNQIVGRSENTIVFKKHPDGFLTQNQM